MPTKSDLLAQAQATITALQQENFRLRQALQASHKNDLLPPLIKIEQPLSGVSFKFPIDSSITIQDFGEQKIRLYVKTTKDTCAPPPYLWINGDRGIAVYPLAGNTLALRLAED